MNSGLSPNDPTLVEKVPDDTRKEYPVEDHAYRLFKHHQFQVILKPAPDETVTTFFVSASAFSVATGG